jgi:hypothetical protein
VIQLGGSIVQDSGRVWGNLVKHGSDIKRGGLTEDISEQGAEENIWIEER